MTKWTAKETNEQMPDWINKDEHNLQKKLICIHDLGNLGPILLNPVENRRDRLLKSQRMTIALNPAIGTVQLQATPKPSRPSFRSGVVIP